jgi:hypothetical protein
MGKFNMPATLEVPAKRTVGDRRIHFATIVTARGEWARLAMTPLDLEN